MIRPKRELIEWGVIITVFLGLYLSGLHTDVIGFVQRAVLAPGFIKPDILEEDEQSLASYNFDLIDESGKRVSFEDFRGKTVFLNIWATWCPPCVAEMPDINNLYAKVDTDKIAFVMISRDDDFNKAKSFMERKAFDFPIYSQATRLPEVFQSNTIPNTYVISPQGKIVATRTGMAKYDSKEFREFISRL
ncbi:MAG: TlpA family protein disulfide reductase [Cyclobacteriaceae bacterium]